MVRKQVILVVGVEDIPFMQRMLCQKQLDNPYQQIHLLLPEKSIAAHILRDCDVNIINLKNLIYRRREFQGLDTTYILQDNTGCGRRIKILATLLWLGKNRIAVSPDMVHTKYSTARNAWDLFNGLIQRGLTLMLSLICYPLILIIFSASFSYRTWLIRRSK